MTYAYMNCTYEYPEESVEDKQGSCECLKDGDIMYKVGASPILYTLLKHLPDDDVWVCRNLDTGKVEDIRASDLSRGREVLLGDGRRAASGSIVWDACCDGKGAGQYVPTKFLVEAVLGSGDLIVSQADDRTATPVRRRSETLQGAEPVTDVLGFVIRHGTHVWVKDCDTWDEAVVHRIMPDGDVMVNAGEPTRSTVVEPGKIRVDLIGTLISDIVNTSMSNSCNNPELRALLPALRHYRDVRRKIR